MPHRDEPDQNRPSDEHLIRQLASLDPPYTEPHWGQFRGRVLARLRERQAPRESLAPQVKRRWSWGRAVPQFHVVEVLSVMIILGLLAAITMPRLVGQTDKAWSEQAKIQIRILEDALKRYKLELGRFPTTEEGLSALVHPPASVADKWPTGGYLDKPEVPLDPWGNAFIYISPGLHHPDYDLLSLGADGRVGGSGYDADVESWNL